MTDIEKTLNAMPTRTTLAAFDNDRYFGIIVGFIETGFGFGEITFSVDKATGEGKVGLEEMSPKHCGEILMRAVGHAVVNGNEP